MAETKGLGLPQTKGTFQLRGKVTGVEKDSFYNDKPSKNGNPFRRINFGTKVDDEQTVYVSLQSGERQKVYFSKSVEENGKKKTVVEDVPWKDRFKFNKEGFRLIGVNLGITKKEDEKGSLVNDNKTMTDYDACEEISKHLKDEQSVFIKGNTDFSHFKDQGGNVKRATKFVPTQISLCKKEIDFDEEDFEVVADFTQQIVFMGINKVEDRFVVEAKIITYNSVEEAEFYIDDKDLASKFKKGLKPYNSIKVWGKIRNISDTTEVTDDNDAWGESNSMDRVNNPTKRELVIVGADGSNIDKETYSEEIIDNAIAKINANSNAEKEYGSNDNWGNSSNDENEEW